MTVTVNVIIAVYVGLLFKRHTYTRTHTHTQTHPHIHRYIHTYTARYQEADKLDKQLPTSISYIVYILRRQDSGFPDSARGMPRPTDLIGCCASEDRDSEAGGSSGLLTKGTLLQSRDSQSPSSTK